MIADILSTVETENDVASIRAGGMQLWPLLRIVLYFELMKAQGEAKQNPTLPSRFHKKISSAGSIFLGTQNWFRKYDALILGSSGLRRPLGDGHWDKSFDPIIAAFTDRRFLYIDRSPDRTLSGDDIPTSNVVSAAAVDLAALSLRTVCRSCQTIENETILQTILAAHAPAVDYRRIVRSFFAYYRTYAAMMARYRPKVVLINCAYGNFPAVRAARDQHIPVIEMQHGVIGKAHPAYNFRVQLDERFYPNYLLSFGQYDKDVLKESRYVPNDCVFPVGNFYLDYMRKNFLPNPSLSLRVSQFRTSVAVTLQQTVEQALLEFTIQVALADPDVLFVLVPRNKRASDYRHIAFPENVIFRDDLNFYQIAMHCTFHTTVYSTCALEAPYLGKFNLLFDYKGLAAQYFGDVLKNDTTRYIATTEEYATRLQANTPVGPEKLKQAGEYLFEKDVETNIKNVIAELTGF